MLVFENNNYTVVKANSLVEGFPIYQVINKITDVVEMEEPMLPKCIDYAQQLNAGMSELMEQLDLFPDNRSTH